MCFAVCFFFFNDTATTEIYTLSLHDALPISRNGPRGPVAQQARGRGEHSHPARARPGAVRDDEPRHLRHQIGRSTRLNSSHANISYAVFCLKKKKTKTF